MMEAAGAPEMYDKIWFHKTSTAVIDADRCVGCGACIAACPVEVDRGRDRRPPDARADVHRVLGVLGLLPDGGHAGREAQPPGRARPGGRGHGGRVRARGRAARRRPGRRRGHGAARDVDGARRDRRRDPDAEARRVRGHARSSRPRPSRSAPAPAACTTNPRRSRC